MLNARCLLIPMGILVFCVAGGSYGTAQELSGPEANFEYLWQTYDRNYGIFGAKKVDWNALYQIYRPQVTPETGDDELFDIMGAMLGHLNDNHVRLQSSNRAYRSGILGDMKMEDFSLDLIREKYLGGESVSRVDNVFNYGWLSDSIGYFHFSGFGRLERSEAAIDEIIAAFAGAEGIIVDVRANGGGDDRVGKLIADRFADRKRHYMTTYTRNGPGHDDFSAPKYWYVEPNGPAQFTKTVILLTHRFSVSAAENFALAMRVLPHVTVVGDATSGVFADVYRDRLPNGWSFSVSYKLFVDQTGFCWEGIGVPADIRQTNSAEDIARGRDKVLELAVALIDSGSLALQSEPSSLVNVRTSLVKQLAAAIDTEGVESAVEAFRREKSGSPDAYAVDEDELNDLGRRLLREGRPAEAIEVFKIGVNEFPQSIAVLENLGAAYLEAGETKQGRLSYQKALEVNRRSYPWERESYERAQKILAGGRVLAQGLERALDRGELAKELARYHDNPESYYVNESDLNRLGYRLLEMDRAREAVEVFKINVQEFSDSWNAWDSLGEAYMANGNRELAIESYERSIELFPGNSNAKEMLKKLEEKESP